MAVLIVLGGIALYTGAMATGYFASKLPKHRAETAWFIFVGLAAVVGASRSAGRASESEGPDGGHLSTAMSFLPLGLFTLLLYLPVFRVGLLSDDFVLMSRAAQHDYWRATSSGFFRPVPLLLWSALLAVFDRFGILALHGLNVLLHALNAVLVVRLAERLALPRFAVVLAGVLFVCFPASVEPVAWASGVQDVLLTTAALVYVLGSTRRVTPWTIAISTLALVVALGTKETAIAIPVLALLLVSDVRRPVHLALPVVGLLAAFVYALWRVFTLGAQQHQTELPSQYFAKEMLSRAFGTLGVPFTGGELTHFAVLGAGFSWLFLILTLALLAQAHTHRHVLTTSFRAALWIITAVLPVYAFFYITPELQGSRYLYLASCGWAVLVAAGVTSLQAIPRAAYVAGGVLVVVWTLAVRSHLTDWQQAATVRDAVVRSAARQLTVTSCRPLEFSGLPDSVGGAYVFRNGFGEALAAEGMPPGAAAVATNTGACVVTWNGAEFR